MPEVQWNDRAHRFIDELGLRDRVHFVADPSSAVIRELGVLRPNPEPIEEGVPHPTTILVDRNGIVRFVDVRRDFHIWLDPSRLLLELSRFE